MGRWGEILGIPFVILTFLYIAAWGLVGIFGLVAKWGAVAGILASFLGITLPYGVFVFATEEWHLPIWGAILLAIPPNFIAGGIVAALDR